MMYIVGQFYFEWFGVMIFGGEFRFLFLIRKSITDVPRHTEERIVIIEHDSDCPSELSLALLLIDQRQHFAIGNVTYGQKVDIS